MAKIDRNEIAKNVIARGLREAGIKPLRNGNAWVIDLDRANVGGENEFAIIIVNADERAGQGLAYALSHTGGNVDSGAGFKVLPRKKWMRAGEVHVIGDPVPRLAALAHIRDDGEVEYETADIDGFKRRFAHGAGKPLSKIAFIDAQSEDPARGARWTIAHILNFGKAASLENVSVITHHDNDMTIIQLDNVDKWQRQALATALAQMQFRVIDLKDVPANQIYLQGDPAAAEKLSKLSLRHDGCRDSHTKTMIRLRANYADAAVGGHEVDLFPGAWKASPDCVIFSDSVENKHTSLAGSLKQRPYNFASFVDALVQDQNNLISRKQEK